MNLKLYNIVHMDATPYGVSWQHFFKKKKKKIKNRQRRPYIFHNHPNRSTIFPEQMGIFSIV